MSATAVFASLGALPVEDAPATEAELVRRARGGDGHAFAALVRPHLGLLYRVAARSCGSGPLAEDAVQEALSIAYAQLDRYEPDTSLRSFLAAIAARRSHTLARAERRRAEREDASDAPPSAADPAELVSAHRRADVVRRALASLPPKRREVAILRLDAGLSYAEIASAVGSTEGSARVLVHQAVSALRAALAAEGHDSP